MIDGGKLIYKLPTIKETREKVKQELSTLWEEALRIKNSHTYVINLSNKLQKVKDKLLNEYQND